MEVPTQAGNVHPAGQQHPPGATGAQRGDRVRRVRGVGGVAPAHHGDRRTGAGEGPSHLVSAGGGPSLDCLDAPRVKEVAGERRSGGVVRDRPEGGEEGSRPRTGGRELRVGPVAVALEGFGEAVGRQARWAGATGGGESGRMPGSESDQRNGRSARLGNSLTPVTGTVLVAMSDVRRSRTSAARWAMTPETSAATAPPAASISWKNAHSAG